VSSALFYIILAASVNLDVGAVMTHDHAFVTLNVGNGALVDIETTNRYGFDPGSRIEFRNDFGRITGYAYVEPQHYMDRASISQLELISLILLNRINIEKRPAASADDALPLLANRAALLSARAEKTVSPFFGDPEKDLIDNLLNAGARLANAGNDDAALRFAVLVDLSYPNNERWQQFSYTVLYNTVVRLLQRQRIEEALKVLNANASLVSYDNFIALSGMVTDAELAALISAIKTTSDAEDILTRLTDPHLIVLLGGNRVNELRSFTLNSEAILFVSEKGWAAAIQFAEAALNRYGGNAQLESNLAVFRANRVIELHNAFVNLWNSGKRAEARDFLSAALKEYPRDAQLTRDWAAIETSK
jgi:tetratricopeptide (TPR) repeat protein